MLNIDAAVSVEPMAIQLRHMEKKTTNQTAFIGVRVYGFILANILSYLTGQLVLTYFESLT